MSGEPIERDQLDPFLVDEAELPALTPGQMVDHFRVSHRIGRGGMAEVYQARDTKLGRKVALKVVQPADLGSQEAIERFLFEARTTASFSHPHITTVYAVGEADGRPYVALEYLEGRSLRQVLHEERIAVTDVMRIGLAIAEALAEAHRHNILHRDLKPENVMLPLDGRLRVVDFGLAKILSSEDRDRVAKTGPFRQDSGITSPNSFESHPQDLCGTPAYMAPEQWQRQPVSGATDIWALGVILYELTFQRRPYGEILGLGLALKVCDRDPVPFFPDSHTPEPFCELIRRCLAKPAAERPTAEQVSEALGQLLAQRRLQQPAVQSPFRGLFPFDERHAHLFFGRETELAAFLERLRLEPVMPIIGPSGAGKSSFVQAGVLPRLQERAAVTVLRLRPGARPFEALAVEVLAAEQDRRRPVHSPLELLPTAKSSDELTALQELGHRDQEGEQPDAKSRPEPAPLRSEVPLRRVNPDSLPAAPPESDREPELPPTRRSERAMAEFSSSQDVLRVPPPEPSWTELPSEASLRASLGADVATEEIERLAAKLAGAPHLLNVRLHRLSERTGRWVVLFVDQLEELSTLVDSPAERRSFMKAICLAADDHLLPVRVVLTLREEFLSRLAEEAEVRQAFNQITMLRPPTAEALREVLVHPVELMGLHFEPGLAADMVAEVAGEISCLPLLQFAGRMLWERRDRDARTITRTAYEEIGGVAGALAQHADGVLNSLTEAEVGLARTMLLRMVTPEGTRQVLRHQDLLEGQPAAAQPVLDRLIQARLLHIKRGAAGKQAELELAHESLIVTWKQLSRWIDESREELVVVAEIEQAAQLWEKRGERAEEAWHGDALRDAQRAIERGQAELSRQATAFLTAGERRQSRLTRRKRFQVGAALSLLAMAAVAATLVALTLSHQKHAVELARTHAERQRAEALVEGARSALGRGQPLQARAQLRTALEAADTTAARVLWWQLEQDPAWWQHTLGQSAHSADFSPDGQTVAVACSDANVYLLDAVTSSLRRVLRGHTDGVRMVRFSPNGRWLASAGFDHTARLWRTSDGGVAQVLDRHSSLVGGVAFSPDGALLATASRDRTVRLWDVGSGEEQRVLEGHEGGVWAVSFSPDGAELASAGDDRSIRLWKVATGELITVLEGHQAEVHDLSFGPTGHELASASWDGTIGVWDLDQHRRRLRLTGHHGEVWRVSFLPGGTQLASSGGDGTVRLWDVASGHEVREWSAHTGDSYAVRFSPDGKLLVSTGSDNAVRLWDLRIVSAPAPAAGHLDAVYGVAFSPDGSQLASSSVDQTIRLWDVAAGMSRRVLRGHTGDVDAVVYSPDGKLLASSSADGSVRLWDPQGGAALRVIVGQLGRVEDLAFHPQGRRLAALVRNRVQIWEVDTGVLAQELFAPGAVLGASDVEYSPDGSLVLAAGRDRVVRIWDADSGELVRELKAHGDATYGVAFAPDGSRFATGSYDHTIRLWPLPEGEPTLLELPAGVDRLAFNPRGHQLGATTIDMAGMAFLIDLEHLRQLPLRGHYQPVNRIAFRRDGSLAATSSEDGTVRTWDTATGHPRWRAPVLLTEPPRLYTHRGWRALAKGIEDEPAPSSWRRAVEDHGRYGSLAPSEAYLCLQTYDDHVELWNLQDDKRLLRRPVPELRRVVATPDSCLSLDAKGRVLWHDPGTDRQLLEATARAVAWDKAGITIATSDRALLFDTTGGSRQRELPIDVGATASYRTADFLFVGYQDGHVDRIPLQDSLPERTSCTREAVPSSPVLRMLVGPRGTLVVGFANGQLGIWDTATGQRLNHTQLHGPVVHLTLRGERLYAASDLGSHVVWALDTLELPHCALLQRIWQAVPVGWQDGRAVRQAPPPDHRCTPGS